MLDGADLIKRVIKRNGKRQGFVRRVCGGSKLILIVLPHHLKPFQLIRLHLRVLFTPHLHICVFLLVLRELINLGSALRHR